MISDCHLFFIFFLAGPKEPLESTFKDVSEFLLNETSPSPPKKKNKHFFSSSSGGLDILTSRKRPSFVFLGFKKKKKRKSCLLNITVKCQNEILAAAQHTHTHKMSACSNRHKRFTFFRVIFVGKKNGRRKDIRKR